MASYDDDERLYSSERDSDDSPILSYRYDRYRHYAPYSREIKAEERERRLALSILAKVFLFCTAMILFCVLMYIPVYYRANDQMPKGFVAGWTINTNRDTKIYVQPNNVTTIHEPKDICVKNKKLFLLIIVCSSTTNFEQRNAIRETWGDYKLYLESSKVYNKVRSKYKNYNFTYDLYTDPRDSYNVSGHTLSRVRRDASGLAQLLPELAKALQSNLATIKDEEDSEKRFDDDDAMLPEFDMNKELGDHTESHNNYDYDYESNVMRIPPRGYEDTPDLDKILNMLRKDKNFPKIEENLKTGNTDPDFRVVFLLGLPANDNDTKIQKKIEEEVNKYGDIIQEGFVDSYNNLTLKSIMMLKWITNKCNESVRYILKTDDDMFINVPNLMYNLKNRSAEFDSKVAKGYKDKEYLLIGDLICGARPVQDSSSKWFSPRYMYGAREYPRYLSGTGYVLSAPAAALLRAAALETPYFHLEDIYITGMCAARAEPALVARHDAWFSRAGGGAGARGECAGLGRASLHRVPPGRMRALSQRARDARAVHRCEKLRLTQPLPPRRQYVQYRNLRLHVTKRCS